MGERPRRRAVGQAQQQGEAEQAGQDSERRVGQAGAQPGRQGQAAAAPGVRLQPGEGLDEPPHVS